MQVNRNIPNVLTIGRIVLIPFFLNFLVYGYTRQAMVVFVVAAVSDALDGALARYGNARTELGAFLDPVADKLLALFSFTALSIMGYVPLWLTLAVVFRDAVLASGSIALYMMGRKVKIEPHISGKLTTFLQSLVIVLALAGVVMRREFALIEPLSWVTLAFVAYSGALYVIRGIAIARGKQA